MDDSSAPDFTTWDTETLVAYRDALLVDRTEGNWSPFGQGRLEMLTTELERRPEHLLAIDQRQPREPR